MQCARAHRAVTKLLASGVGEQQRRLAALRQETDRLGDLPVRDLEKPFRKAMEGAPRNQLLLEFDDDVPHGIVVAIQDAAAGARINRIHFVLPAGK